MPTQTLTVQQVDIDGLTPSRISVDELSVEFLNDGKTFIHIDNQSGQAVICTIKSEYVNPPAGTIATDRSIICSDTEERMIGPFPQGSYNDPETGLVLLTFDDNPAGLEIGAFKL